MYIQELFKSKRPVVSFEIFPPKQNSVFDSIISTTKELSKLRPDFISITYGAAGSTRNNTLEVAEYIKKEHGIETLAHLTCIANSSEEIERILDDLHRRDIKNILAMRGDLPEGATPPDRAIFAKHLIEQIQKRQDFFIAAAAYPEGHTQAKSLAEDIVHVGEKVAAGAKLLITQIFFDNALLYRYQELLAKNNIRVHLSAGIMPIFNAPQILRIIKLCGASVPESMSKILSRYAENPKALEAAGEEYACRQIADLAQNGVDGIHIYTMNKPHLAKNLVEKTGLR